MLTIELDGLDDLGAVVMVIRIVTNPRLGEDVAGVLAIQLQPAQLLPSQDALENGLPILPDRGRVATLPQQNKKAGGFEPPTSFRVLGMLCIWEAKILCRS
jgi:hypothetical protein